MRPNRRIEETVQNGFVINLPSEVTIKEIPAIKIKSSTLEIIYVKDNSSEKKIISNVKGFGDVVLWESEAYDRLGQWTDADVKTRLIELFLK
jgi:hypothetical protein